MNDEGFRVDSVEKAAEVMRKYRGLAQRKKRNEDLAQKEHDRIDRWLSAANASVSAQMEFLDDHISAFAISQRASGVKTLDLPDGVVKTRQTGVTFDVDKSVFLEWAQDAKRDDLLRVTLAPDMTAIKTALIPDGGSVIDPISGEVVPGLSPVPERVAVSIAPDMEAVDLEGFDDEGEEDE